MSDSFVLWGPKLPDHPSIGRLCPRCKTPFVVGDMTMPDPSDADEPADPDEFLKKAQGRPYTAIVREIHVRCS